MRHVSFCDVIDMSAQAGKTLDALRSRGVCAPLTFTFQRYEEAAQVGSPGSLRYGDQVLRTTKGDIIICGLASTPRFRLPRPLPLNYGLEGELRVSNDETILGFSYDEKNEQQWQVLLQTSDTLVGTTVAQSRKCYARHSHHCSCLDCCNPLLRSQWTLKKSRNLVERLREKRVLG